MKLLTITTRYLLIVVLSVLIIWTAVFYFSLQQLVYVEINEHLNYRVFEIKQLFQNNPSFTLISEKSHKADYAIQRIGENDFNAFKKQYPEGKYENFMRFEETENEEEPFRKIETVFLNNGNYYRLAVESSLVDTKEMLSVILLDMLALSIVLAVFILFFNRLLLRRLWKPFYETLEKIKKYRVDKNRTILLSHGNVTEFEELNSSVKELIDANNKVYLQQKQFIENASHEIQTPLAIAMSKLELFTEEENLTEDQANLIKSARQSLDRLSRLNRSLMLLSKIDNRQFENTEWVEAGTLVNKILFEYEEMIEFKKLTCEFTENDSMRLLLNPDLAYIMFSNLIRNAIFHNVPEGFLHITIVSKNEILIENTGKEIFSEPGKMFDRFTKGSDHSFSQGLGLAIVASICELYNYKASYVLHRDIHVISLVV